MAHPDSDGIGEMLEGGSRTASTAALRAVEMVQRRRQWTAQHLTRDVQAGIRDTVNRRRALTNLADLTDAGYQQWIAEQQTHLRGPVEARQLFPHLDTAAADTAFEALVDNGDHVDYVRAYRDVLDEAGHSTRHEEPADLHRRAGELFTDAQRDDAASVWERVASAEAQELAKLRQQLAIFGDDTGLTADLRAASLDLVCLLTDPPDPFAAARGAETTFGLVAEVKTHADARLNRPKERGDHTNGEEITAAEHLHDAALARDQRADRLLQEGFDTETTQAALIHDLSFGTPASSAPTSRKPSVSAGRSQPVRPKGLER
jgi:hypothetical protein